MCGICGKVSLVNDRRNHRPVVQAMSDAIIHRGPDDFGIYSDEQVALGHRRLAIIDLSTGRQPISNEDGTIWIIFNGEVYNYRELRRKLVARGHAFATATDTEVIVHLYEEFGTECVSHLEGMFAFAIWDKREKRLFLARDRIGIKPLYYARTKNSLLFASELKGLLADPECPRDLNLCVLDRFLTFYYTPGHETLFRGIHKLEPGQWLTVFNGCVTTHHYWDLSFPVNPRSVTFAQAKDELLDLLDKSVEAHMISDVPVGVLLSGGVDSSTVLTLAAQHTTKPLSTFTIGFDGTQFVDERPYAELVAKQVGADHHEITISPAQFRDFLPKYVWHMEEAICEPPAVALYFVTKLAREHGIKVVLSGEGGDESFAGYQTYPKQLWIERIRGMGSSWSSLSSELAHIIAQVTGQKRFADLARLLHLPLESRYFSRTANPTSYFRERQNELYSDDLKAAVDNYQENHLADLFAKMSGRSPLSRMLYVDSKTWLPDDLLLKADKMTMANSVELRVPLLDHKLLEFAAALPDNFKVRGHRTKHVMKEALRGKLPRAIIRRKKAGFPVPVMNWMNAPLRDYVRDILTDSRSLSRGYWKLSGIESMLAADRQAHLGAELFCLVTIELWHREFVDGTPVLHAACV
jgi:asparagine synthase (glutamine-hydrolysing)